MLTILQFWKYSVSDKNSKQLEIGKNNRLKLIQATVILTQAAKEDFSAVFPRLPKPATFYLPLALVSINIIMIKSFASKETEKVWQGIYSKKLPSECQKIGRRKLRMINNSIDINDLRMPPANRLEKLSGNLKDFYSIRINKQWRIIFKWKNGHAFEVEIVHYH